MEKQDLIKIAEEFVENSKENYITEEMAISEKVVGMKIFDAPIFAFCSADDECFALLKQPSAIGQHFLLPEEWLPQSKTVISFFLPFTEAVRKGNRKDMSWPSEEWLHGRIEGQILVNKLSIHLKSELESAGYESLVPSLDQRFWSNTSGTNHEIMFTSNWSERHAAFVCGLGTFGLSKGLITPKGMAGRFGSIITGLYLSPDRRDYENVYEYCSMCGKCVKNCPANAITVEDGKDHFICSEFLNKTREKHSPRYGCGKCQIDVPCESQIPKKLNKTCCQELCPACCNEGSAVKNVTVKHMVLEGMVEQVGDSDYYLCMNNECEVAYYCNETGTLFNKQHVNVPLWYKKDADSKYVCYCSKVTEEQVIDAVLKDGAANMREVLNVTGAMKNSQCQIKNPLGICCHQVIQDAIDKALSMKK